MTSSAPDATLLTLVAAALGLETVHILEAQFIDTRVRWLGLLLDETETLAQLEPDFLALQGLGLNLATSTVQQAQEAIFLIVRSNREARAFGARSSEAQASGSGSRSASASAAAELNVRAFSATLGAEINPLTDGLQASLTQWLIAKGHLASA